jgi:ribonuclease HII
MLKPSMTGNLIEAGCDEAGRGCLAGPVYAAAVILPPGYHNELLNDSKKLTRKQRESLRTVIEKDALSWAVESVDNQTIDQINILNASILAMHLALKKLQVVPQLILVDGNRFHAFPGIDHKCVVKGDSIYMSIAAASILAKTHRDELMCKLHLDYPQYQWNKNKGYPTITHRTAINLFGTTPFHRLSFRLGEQLKLFR